MWTSKLIGLVGAAALGSGCLLDLEETRASSGVPPVPPSVKAPIIQSPRVQRPRFASGLRFNIEPPDAVLLIDGEARGRADQVGATGGLKLRPGVHRITLQRSGYLTWRGEVTVDRKVDVLEVRLEKRP